MGPVTTCFFILVKIHRFKNLKFGNLLEIRPADLLRLLASASVIPPPTAGIVF